jgi:hypothetical protein
VGPPLHVWCRRPHCALLPMQCGALIPSEPHRYPLVPRLLHLVAVRQLSWSVSGCPAPRAPPYTYPMTDGEAGVPWPSECLRKGLACASSSFPDHRRCRSGTSSASGCRREHNRCVIVLHQARRPGTCVDDPTCDVLGERP